MASTVGIRYESGKVKATNAELTVGTLPFTPEKITINNLGNNVKAEWNKALGSGQFVKTLEAGTRSLVTSGGPTPASGGFVLPVLADINDAGVEELNWECWGY